MLKDLTKIVGVSILFLVLFICFNSFAEEKVTLTTYYPAPYGVYKEMRADQMTVGSNYKGTTVGDGQLFVERNIGVGTDTPEAMLQVRGSFRSYLTVGYFRRDDFGCEDIPGEWILCALSAVTADQNPAVPFSHSPSNGCAVQIGADDPGPISQVFPYPNGTSSDWRLCVGEKLWNVVCGAVCIKFDQ